MATPSAAVGPPERGAPPPPDGGTDLGRRRRYLIAFGFLLPALVFLSVWVIYPTVYTVIRSFYDRSGDSFIGLRNYSTLFTTDILLTAIRNNVIWVAVVPALVTSIGLVFAVLTERIRWSVAFKTAVFMPMAISLFAAGVIWRIAYDQDPSRGTVNAAVSAVDQVFNPPGVLTGARRRRRRSRVRRAGLHARQDAAGGRRDAARPHRDPLRRYPRDRRAGGEAGAARRAASPASSGETSSLAAARPARSSTASSAFPA